MALERFRSGWDVVYKNRSLQRLYQRVPLSTRKTVLRKTVHDSAWMFEKVIQRGLITRDQGGVLVYATREDQQDRTISAALDELRSVTRVLNLADGDTVLREFEAVASIPVHV